MSRLIANVLRLAVLLAVVGGGLVAYTYYRSDDLLRQEILKQLSAAFPEASISIERANFDLRGRVRIFDLAMRLPDETRTALSIAETIVTVDRQQLAEKYRVIVERVRISQPKIRVVRAPDGRWNWQNLKFVKPPGNNDLPDVEVLHGLVEVVLADHVTRTMVNVPVDDVMITARPASRKSYSVEASARTEFTGALTLQGELPLEAAGWALNGTLKRCRLDPATTRLALIAAPELEPKFLQLQQWLSARVPPEAGVSRSQTTLPPPNSYDLGTVLIGDVRLQLAQADPQTPPDWSMRVDIADGRCTHAILPSPLFEVRAAVDVTPQQVAVRNLTARNGQSRIQVDAVVVPSGAYNLLLDLTAIPIDEPLIVRLPDSLQRVARSTEITGISGGKIQIQCTPGGQRQTDADLTLDQGTIRHERFPYLIRDVTATLAWHHDVVELQGEGLGGTTPVRAFGTIHRPGPDGSAAFDIRAANVAVDDEILQALPASIARVVQDLQFQGRGDVWLRLLRPEGLDQKYQVRLDANVREATVQPRVFPYPVTQLSGRLKWHDDVVQFEQLRGTHDGAVLTGAGRFDLAPHPGRLSLEINATNAAFDRALYTSLPSNLQEVWAAFAPQGEFDVSTNFDWTVGGPVTVNVPRFHVLNADFQMREFPYPFSGLQGQFSYRAADQRVDLYEFSAHHDDTRISGQGYALCHDDGTVTVSLEKFHVDDLTPTPALRRALPQALRDTLETLNPAGRYSFHGPVKVYGDQRRGGLVGAEWDVQILLAGCAINVGLRADDIHGRVHLKGNWTPRRTELDGQIDLDALDVLVNHQFTKIKGPFRLRDGILVIGSEQMANSQSRNSGVRVTSDQRITGQAFDGEAVLDAVVDVNNEPVYQAAMELSNASLERYAMRHLRGYSNVRGLVNGWMEVRGRGIQPSGLTGEGQLQISPAALYELPVFLQIFQLPQLAPNSRTAFDYANFFFRIDNERFNFESIDLVGNTISLKGRGVVRFDGGVTLDFYTMQPRNPVRIIGLRELVGAVNMLSQGWLAVEVRGPIAAPVARVVPFPAVDEALQQFLGAFNPRPPAMRRGPAPANPPRATTIPAESRRQ